MPVGQHLRVQAPAPDLDPLKQSMIKVYDQVATTVGIVRDISANMLGNIDTLEASSRRLEKLAGRDAHVSWSDRNCLLRLDIK